MTFSVVLWYIYVIYLHRGEHVAWLRPTVGPAFWSLCGSLVGGAVGMSRFTTQPLHFYNLVVCPNCMVLRSMYSKNDSSSSQLSERDRKRFHVSLGLVSLTLLHTGLSWVATRRGFLHWPPSRYQRSPVCPLVDKNLIKAVHHVIWSAPKSRIFVDP